MKVTSAAAVLVCLLQDSKQDSKPSAVDWAGDLEVLVTEIKARHKNPFTVISEKEFDARADALRKSIGSLPADRATVEFMKLVAAIGDSHSGVSMGELTDTVPLKLYWWPDGLRVFGARRDDAQIVGCRVVAIAGHPVADVVLTLTQLQCCENDAQVKNAIPSLMVQHRLLHAAGIAPQPDRRFDLSVTLEDKDGKELAVTLARGQLRENAVYAPTPNQIVTAQRAGKWHHHEWLEKDGILYVQYNQCATSKQQDLDAFTDALDELLDSKPVKAIVFDVQYNGGGSSMLGDRLFARLARREPMKSKKNVFCVIGRATFSSAILNALALKHQYGAVLVGSETGGSPNHFGEVKTFVLPSSKLTVRYSTKRFEHAGHKGETTIAPDHKVERTWQDYVAGRDPILETIRSLIR